MLFHSKMPLKYWVEAFYSANFISNLLPSTSLQQKSPFEVLFTKSPDYTFLRVFGSACYPCLRPFTQHIFDPRSLQCVFLGYHAQYKGYRCLYPPTGRVYVCRHVIFDELCFPFNDRYKHLAHQHKTVLLQTWQSAETQAPVLQRLPTLPSQVVHYPQDLLIVTNSPGSTCLSSTRQPVETESDITSITVSEPEEQEDHTVNRHPMTTRSKTGIRKPNPRYALVASKTIPPLPQTVANALAHPGWYQAMIEELDSIYQNHTWSLTPATAEMNTLGCR